MYGFKLTFSKAAKVVKPADTRSGCSFHDDFGVKTNRKRHACPLFLTMHKDSHRIRSCASDNFFERFR